jgi:hypothetical protein
MSIIEGTIYVARIGSKWGLKGFTRKDMYTLGKLARKLYKIKTKRSRIVKKYVIRLITDALRKYDRSA